MMKLSLLVFLSSRVLPWRKPARRRDAGVQGVILIGPVMGGPTREGAPEAKPLPEMEFVVKQGERVVTSFRTDQGGPLQGVVRPGSLLGGGKREERHGILWPLRSGGGRRENENRAVEVRQRNSMSA